MPSPIGRNSPPRPVASDGARRAQDASAAPRAGASSRSETPLSNLGRPPALRLAIPGGAARAAPPRLALDTGATSLPAAVPSAPSGRRFGLDDTIDANPRPLPANDFLGRRADNQLPALMMDATRRGPVLSVANSTAVLAAFGTGPHRVAVADISPGHLAGVQDVLKMAADAPSQEAWLAAVKQRHGAIGSQLETALARAGSSASFDRMKERVAQGEIDLHHVDLATDQAAGLRESAGPSGFSAVYASNIEMYVAGFLNHGQTSAAERQQGLDKYRGNLLGRMHEEAAFVRGTAMGPMEVSSKAQAQEGWHPQAS